MVARGGIGLLTGFGHGHARQCVGAALLLRRRHNDVAQGKRARCVASLQIAHRECPDRDGILGPPTSGGVKGRPVRSTAKSPRRAAAAASAERPTAPQACHVKSHASTRPGSLGLRR